MPSLILSSHYSIDSQQLRIAAQQQGWETVRLENESIPDWFEPPDDSIAIFYTAPHAFQIADQFSRRLLGCHPAWTVELPPEFLNRDLRQMRLAEALELPGRSFVKHAVSKAFPAAVYDSTSLAEATSRLSPESLVHVGEIVDWLVEYRCFVVERSVIATSPYRRIGEIFADDHPLLGAPPSEIDAATEFAMEVLSSPIPCPPAFVLDVGLIAGRGWSVVEPNECWASGIYACEPKQVLNALVRACVPTETILDEERRWDFERHYSAACPKL